MTATITAFVERLLSPANHDPFRIVAIQEGEGAIVTSDGEIGIDDAAQLLIANLGSFDWQAYVDRPPGAEADELVSGLSLITTLASLVAQINLYQARLLWSIKVPERIGMLRMLDKRSEAEELRYQQCLTAERTLSGEELASFVLETSAFMDTWGKARCDLVPRNELDAG